MSIRLAKGFTLLEALVAVLVLAFGVLGASAMQLAALRARHESQLLSNAAQLASSMADRMRANPAEIGPVYLTLDYDAAIEPRPRAPDRQCWDGDCDNAAVALADLYDLKQQVAAQLPGGRVRICRDAGMWDSGRLRWPCGGGPAAPVVIKIGWRGRNPDGSPQKDDSGGYAPGVALAMAGGGP
jgi:type IV pilus assembly protein PilV